MEETPSHSQLIAKEDSVKHNFAVVQELNAIISTSIGPSGALKLLETDNGELYMTKDGGRLFRSLRYKHPTAILVARAAESQSEAHHDSVSSLLCLLNGILKYSSMRLEQGYHPRRLCNALTAAKEEALKILDTLSIPLQDTRSSLLDVARTYVSTKINANLAPVIVDAFQTIRREKMIDLDDVEIVRVKTGEFEAKLAKGVIFDQGFRHELMNKSLTNVSVLCLSVSLEQEPPAVNTLVETSTTDQKERLTIAARRFVDDKLRAIIAFKESVGGDFLLINALGIDKASHDILAHAGISALRRVSRKKILRIIRACGGSVVNHVDDLVPSIIGHAESVEEKKFMGQKFVFLEGGPNSKAASIAVGGFNDMKSGVIADTIEGGLITLRTVLKDGKVLPGGGATEISLAVNLTKASKSADIQHKVGFDILSQAILSIPNCAVGNSGLDQTTLVNEAISATEKGELSGIDIESGMIVDPTIFGVYDTFSPKKAIIQTTAILASQLLLIDGIITTGGHSDK